MGTISFTGLSSVSDRTLFTNKGPIVKRPLSLLSGSDLRIVSENEIEILSGSFTSSNVGQIITISGSLNNRNDGTFTIDQVKNSTRLVLKNSSFELINETDTIESIIDLANDIRNKYELHRIQDEVHGSNDTTNIIFTAIAVPTLANAIILLNDIKTKFSAHIIDISSPSPGEPTVHLEADVENTVYLPDADDLASALQLVNELRKKYSLHRQSNIYHQNVDSANAVTVDRVIPTVGTYPGSLTGPLSWVLKSPRIGEFADVPEDVDVYVNSTDASVDAVFGLLGAVVLTSKPTSSDTVEIDYDYLNNPAVLFTGLNFPGFTFNQAGNHGIGGLPSHKYRMRAFFIDPENLPNPHGVSSPFAPRLVGWRYKGFERAYTASLNDPNLFRLNSPANKILFPVEEDPAFETSVSYDPTNLPQNVTNPWTSNGFGTVYISGKRLIIIDADDGSGTESLPPFFSKEINIDPPSIVSAAFRTELSNEGLLLDGAFTGVGFGFSDGNNVALIGFIITSQPATNLSSAISLTNEIKTKFNSHVIEPTVHFVNDTQNIVDLVNATNLSQLLIILNSLKAAFNSHIVKVPEHAISDTTDLVTSPDAGDLYSEEISLQQAITLVNELRDKYNTHLSQIITSTNVHQVNDTINVVPDVKQVGILTNRGPWEFGENWNSYAIDFTETKSYRIARNIDGGVSLYLSGMIDPIATVEASELPSISNLNAKFDPIQQVFFGAISKESTSTSRWSFVRTVITPLDPDRISRNKSIDYQASVTPELDTTAPWVPVGLNGFERVNSGILLLDSTASANTNELDSFGLSSGAYRGFLRFEPTQTIRTSTVIEFRTKIDYYTFGINNRSAGVYLDDKNLQVHFSFLQYSPSAPTTIGRSELYPIILGDNLLLRINNGQIITITFAATDTTAATVAAKINSTTGVPSGFASSSSGKIKLTGVNLGVESSFEIVGGTAVTKLGLIIGNYIGSDSNPEPRISYFGADLPDKDNPVWVSSGEQRAELINRALRITDDSVTDYRLFDLSNILVTEPVLKDPNDWKLDTRITVYSYTPSSTYIIYGLYVPVKFAGAFINIDEGVGGKNLELHLSVDQNGNKYVTILSIIASAYIIVFQAPFNWDDGLPHSYNVYMNKASGLVFVLADGQPINDVLSATNSFLTSVLKPSVSGPSVTFGSGSMPIGAIDINTAKSVVDWHSVAVFKDSKINDSNSSIRRYIGLYKGGNENELSSYYVHQIDWTSFHTYRIIRSPDDYVSIFVDNNPTPVISISYDSLRLPLVNTSFLNGITGGIPSIAFGSFNPQELSRTEWDYVKYSLGRIIQRNRLVPRHHLLNYANLITSPDHLFTKAQHIHFGKEVYSEGTASEELIANDTASSYTILGEGTPPIPMTQNLESRGGLVKSITQTKNINTVDFINSNGFPAAFEDDSINVILSENAFDLSTSIALVNELKSKFNSHLTQYRVHVSNDRINIVEIDDASDLTTAIDLVNLIKSKYGSHLIQSGIHTNNDTVNIITLSDATNLATLITLVNEIKIKYESHRMPIVAFANDLKSKFNSHLTQTGVHVVNGTTTVTTQDAADQLSAFVLINDVRQKYNEHLVEIGVHITNDTINSSILPPVTNFSSALALVNEVNSKYDLHRADLTYHLVADTININTYFISLLLIPDVHLSTVIIRLDPPSRVLYEAMKFYTFAEGDVGHLFPFSDDETLHVHGISYAGSHSFSYEGSVLPEDAAEFAVINLANDLKSKYNLHRSQFGVHMNDDILNVVTAPNSTDLSSAITLLNDIKTNYNLHLITGSVHTTNDNENKAININATELYTALSLVNELKSRYEAHIDSIVYHVSVDTTNEISVEDAPPVADQGWLLTTEGPGSASISLITVGPTTALEYGAVGSIETIYKNKNPLPSIGNQNFEMSLSLRINDVYTVVPTFDSRIYAGFTSKMHGGIAAAIGFDSINSVPYVKIHDMNNDETVYRVPFDWGDGNFHSYRLVRDINTNTIGLVIDS